MLARRVASELLALIAPPGCVGCGLALSTAPDVLCPACRCALPWLRALRCPRCALPAPCAPCPAARAPWDRAWAPLAYAGPARELVGALKFRGALPVADLMAAAIAAGAPPELLASATLVPVPLHPARRRARGFDQAERLAGALARRTGRPTRRCLARRGRAVRQMGAGRAVRLARGRLDVEVTGAVPAHAVLVDDVHTTGATFAACARALRRAGARDVSCLAYARTL